MIPYLFQQLGVGLSHGFSTYSKTIQGFGRSEWTFVMIGFAVFGCLCMRGMHRRKT